MTVTGAVTPESIGPAGAGATLRLRVLATTDLHAHLFPFNYFTDRRDDNIGLAGLAALIEQARAECPNALLFDNGDTLQGAPLADAALSELVPRGEVHPMIAAMNGLGYDAVTLGNHDFDFGLDPLVRVMSGARYPVVLANARRIAGGADLFAAHALLERNLIDDGGAVRTLRIGVTGAVPPQVMHWARAHLAGHLEVEQIVPAVQREVMRLRAMGAHLVIVLAHTGLGADHRPGNGENVGRLLARLDGVDAVVAGHTHNLFPRPSEPAGLIGGTPVVQPGYWGSHLGQIDLTLSRQPDANAPEGARWQVTGASVCLRAVADASLGDRAALRRRLKRVPVFRQQMARSHRITRAYSARPLGQTAVPLETFFSMLAPCAATQLIADAQRAAVADLLMARDDLAGLPLISVTTPFKAGGRGGPANYTDIPVGPMLLRHAADLYGFSNGLSLLCATGAQIRDWLERSVSAFHQIAPGPGLPPQPLIDMAFASYNFDRMDGLVYEIDLSQPPRTNADGDRTIPGPGRIRNLRLTCGGPVADDMRFTVVTSSYRAAGGGQFPAAAACETIYTTPDPVRGALISAISLAPRPLAPTVVPGFSFTPLGGAQALFLSGPGSVAHAARASALGLTPDGIDPSGFARYLLNI